MGYTFTHFALRFTVTFTSWVVTLYTLSTLRYTICVDFTDWYTLDTVTRVAANYVYGYAFDLRCALRARVRYVTVTLRYVDLRLNLRVVTRLICVC